MNTPDDTRIYRARKILTMNPAQPVATHLAVRAGRILAVGDAAQAQAWGAAPVDDRYADRVLMPGLVEGHCHLMEGGLWAYVHVGYYDRRGPDGRIWPGLKDLASVVERLKAAEAALSDPAQTLLAWGFDPIHFGSTRLTVDELDQVSATRPVVVMHASLHLMNVNRAGLARAGIDRDCEIEGVHRFPNGEPSGELQEFAAMFPVMRYIGNIFREVSSAESGLRDFGRLAVHAGVTTATDLVNDLSPDSLARLAAVTGEADYPVRLVPAYRSIDASQPATVDGLRRAMASGHERLRIGAVKLVVDGSIQGFTARLRWPGYFNGAPNGIWVTSPEALAAEVLLFHRAGCQLHIHTNGDEATEVALDAVEQALIAHPRPDHRHTLQHCQMADAAQFRRMARLGMCVNLFANHLYYWGEAHLAQTMGPDRAQRMDACATALAHGVPLAIHSDAPITPLAPLFTAWCAVNRRTATGRQLGPAECLTVDQALRAITLGAAWTLKLDHEVGSLEVGKRADLCVLHEDPTAVDPMALKDLRIAGTMLCGRAYEAAGA
jgi:predicted amidohydrolase YtcJ